MNTAVKVFTFMCLIIIIFSVAIMSAHGRASDDAWKSLEEGEKLYGHSQLFDAQKKFEESLKAFEADKLKAGIAAAAEKLGLVYYDLGNYPLAAELFEKAMKSYRELQEKQREAHVLIKLANVYDDWGDFPGSLGYNVKALGMESSLTPKQKGEISSSMGDLYLRMGDVEEAQKHHQKALQIFREAKDRRSEGQALTRIGSLHQNRAEYTEALRAYQEAVAAFTQGGLQSAINEANVAIGSIYLHQGQINDATRIFQGLDYAVGLGQVALHKNDFKKAIDNFNESLRQAAQSHDPEFYFASYIGLGLAHEGSGSFQEAERYLRNATENLEEIRKSLPEGKKLFFLAGSTRGFSRLGAYEALIRVLKAQGKEDAAFNTAELTRARLLTEAIAGKLRAVSTVVPNETTVTIKSSGERVRLSRLISLLRDNQYDVYAPSLIGLLLTAIYESYGEREDDEANKRALGMLNKMGYSTGVFHSLSKKIDALKQYGITNHLTARTRRIENTR